VESRPALPDDRERLVERFTAAAQSSLALCAQRERSTRTRARGRSPGAPRSRPSGARARGLVRPRAKTRQRSSGIRASSRGSRPHVFAREVERLVEPPLARVRLTHLEEHPALHRDEPDGRAEAGSAPPTPWRLRGSLEAVPDGPERGRQVADVCWAWVRATRERSCTPRRWCRRPDACFRGALQGFRDPSAHAPHDAVGVEQPRARPRIPDPGGERRALAKIASASSSDMPRRQPRFKSAMLAATPMSSVSGDSGTPARSARTFCSGARLPRGRSPPPTPPRDGSSAPPSAPRPPPPSDGRAARRARRACRGRTPRGPPPRPHGDAPVAHRAGSDRRPPASAGA